MPAVSKAQQQLMGADLARARAGKATRTGMSATQLSDYAATPRQGLPSHVPTQSGKASRMGYRSRLRQGPGG